MDALSADRGQSLVLTAILLGLAAAAIVGLGGVSHRLVDGVRTQRAGEAAAAAAGAAVADLQFDRARALGRDLDRAEVTAFVADPVVADAARQAAGRLARLHDRADPTDVRVIAIGFEIEVHVTLGGRTHVALLGSNP